MARRYVAAWADEVAPESGRIAALDDRGCHRGLPLSQGRVPGEQIQCGYHGLKFHAHGICAEVQGQKLIPPAARVRPYAMVEQDHLIWFWMGDEDRADPSVIPRKPWYENPTR